MKTKSKKTDNKVLHYIIAQIIVIFIIVVIFVGYFYIKQIIPGELSTKESTITQKIMFDFDNYTMESTSNCGENCIVFEWKDQLPTKLKVNHDTITYGDYTTTLVSGSHFGNLSITSKTISGNKIDSYLLISFPIKSNLISYDYGIYAMYQYDSKVSAIHGSDFTDTASITNSPIRLLGDTNVVLDSNEKYIEKGWLIYQNGSWIKGDTNNTLGVQVTYDDKQNIITYSVTNDVGTFTRTRNIKRK